MINANDYVSNKAFNLTSEEQDAILDYFDSLSNLRAAYEEEYREDGEQSSLDMVKSVSHNMFGAREVLREIGILVAYDWVGHRDEWFFPTYEDALMEEDRQFETMS